MEISDLLLTKWRWVCSVMYFHSVLFTESAFYLYLWRMLPVVWNFYHMLFCNALDFDSGLWPVTRLNIWSKGICVNFKPVLSLRCWSDSIWTKGNSEGVYMAALSRYAVMITKGEFFRAFQSWAHKFQGLAVSCLGIAWCVEAEHLLLSVCIRSRAIEETQGGLLAFPNCVYGEGFVVE